MNTSAGGVPVKASVGKSMQGNTSQDTKPELILRRAMWNHGLKGYRVNCRKVPGTPDICHRRLKLAIFVHGCFWHRCPSCNLPLPKTNTDFWRSKFDRNRQRDERVLSELDSDGWHVEVVWECSLRGKTADIEGILHQLEAYWGG